jgi:hypothetical protein
MEICAVVSTGKESKLERTVLGPYRRARAQNGRIEKCTEARRCLRTLEEAEQKKKRGV